MEISTIHVYLLVGGVLEVLGVLGVLTLGDDWFLLLVRCTGIVPVSSVPVQQNQKNVCCWWKLILTEGYSHSSWCRWWTEIGTRDLEVVPRMDGEVNPSPVFTEIVKIRSRVRPRACAHAAGFNLLIVRRSKRAGFIGGLKHIIRHNRQLL